MRAKIHPELRDVVFKDISSSFTLKTKSTMHTKETIEWEDGKTYPLVRVEVSSHSHPFYTGGERVSQVEGRAARFRKKYGLKKAPKG